MTRIVRVLAPNPGPYTLEGTNTWIVGEQPRLVIDPGPADEGHAEAVARDAGAVAAILLTHKHPDHAPGAALLRALVGAPVFAADPAEGEERLSDGDVLRGGDLSLEAVATPGHTRDHVVFLDRASGSMFTGDAVLGRGTSVINPPDGDMAEYLRSLRRMAALGPRVLYPGHGPAVWRAMAKLEEYVAHREAREREVLRGLEEGPRSPDELVAAIYRDYPRELHAAAARSLLAHLLKLEAEGAARRAETDDEVFELAEPRHDELPTVTE